VKGGPPIPTSDAASELIVSLCGDLALGGTRAAKKLAAFSQWERLIFLADNHGLGPALYAARSLYVPGAFPAGLLAVWKEQYFTQAAKNAWTLNQLSEIAEAFAECGVRLIVLKGVAALLWLYEDIGCRQIRDLDLLVEETAIPEARAIMERLGYSCDVSFPSKESEWLNFHGTGHIGAYDKPGHLTVEIHVNILGMRGRSESAIPDVWTEAIGAELGGPGLKHLVPSHAILHTIVHFMKHLGGGMGWLKDLVDVALAVRKYSGEIDWDTFWRTADRWGVSMEAGTVMAALNHHWDLGVHHVPSGAFLLPSRALAYGLADPEETATRRLLRYYRRRLAKAQGLPNRVSKIRYIVQLVFPSREYIRACYGVPAGKALATYYLRHPFILIGRFFNRLLAAARSSSRS
jgi:hypothetical protein